MYRTAGTQVERRIVTAPVIVDGVRLFRVQGVSSYPARERADAIAARIVEVATNPALGADSLRIEETDVATRIVAGGQFVMNVFDVDAALEGAPRTVSCRAVPLEDQGRGVRVPDRTGHTRPSSGPSCGRSRARPSSC